MFRSIGDSGIGKPGTDGQNMVVIDIASRKVVGNVDFGHGIRPHCPVFDKKSGMLYVTTDFDQTISIIDPKTLKIIGTVPTGQSGVAYARDYQRWALRLHRQCRPRYGLGAGYAREENADGNSNFQTDAKDFAFRR